MYYNNNYLNVNEVQTRLSQGSYFEQFSNNNVKAKALALDSSAFVPICTVQYIQYILYCTVHTVLNS